MVDFGRGGVVSGDSMVVELGCSGEVDLGRGVRELGGGGVFEVHDGVWWAEHFSGLASGSRQRWRPDARGSSSAGGRVVAACVLRKGTS